MSRKRTGDTRSTEDILREMEELSKSIESTVSDISHEPQSPQGQHAPARRGGAMKSLLNFFVSVEPEEGKTATEAGPADASTPERTASPRVADLVAGERPPKFDQPEGGASRDLSTKSFEEIYTEAGLDDSQCSVDELSKLMENPAIMNQPMSVKVVAVNLALSAKGVGPAVPVGDAVRRDRTLDAYQMMLDERSSATEERNAGLILHLTKETEEYLKHKQAEIEALRAETAEAKRQSVDFAIRRQSEEKRLAELISPFLEGKPSPVTVGNQAGEKKVES